MAYVDDVNTLIHHKDIEYFISRFIQLATPLNAILDTDKTRIMTSCSGSSLVQKLLAHPDFSSMMTGKQLETTIQQQYSTETVNGVKTPVETTKGLRVLGTPIGSPRFCHQFLLKALDHASNDSLKLLSNLEDFQMILRIYSTCTAQKTHTYLAVMFTIHQLTIYPPTFSFGTVI